MIFETVDIDHPDGEGLFCYCIFPSPGSVLPPLALAYSEARTQFSTLALKPTFVMLASHATDLSRTTALSITALVLALRFYELDRRSGLRQTMRRLAVTELQRHDGDTLAFRYGRCWVICGRQPRT